MLCSIVLYDSRLIDYDLDVIAGIHFEGRKIYPDRHAIETSRMDILACSRTLPRFKDCVSLDYWRFLVVPKGIDDIFEDLVIIGEVEAELEKITNYVGGCVDPNPYWWWTIDRNMTELVMIDYFVRLDYLMSLGEEK